MPYSIPKPPEDLPFSNLLFNKVERLQVAMEEGDIPRYIRGVNGFEQILIGYTDTEYINEINTLEEEREEALSKLTPSKTRNPLELEQIDFLLSQKKFIALMRLVVRSNFTPSISEEILLK